MAMKIPRRRSANADDSGAELVELIARMRTVRPGVECAELRRQFISYCVERRNQSEDQATSMWDAFRNRPNYLPGPPPKRPSSDE
jgi:hypothetical protein